MKLTLRDLLWLVLVCAMSRYYFKAAKCKMKFSIRDILLSTAIVAMGLGWYSTKRNEILLRRQIRELDEQLTCCDDIIVGFARALQAHGMDFELHQIPGNGPLRIQSVTITGGLIRDAELEGEPPKAKP